MWFYFQQDMESLWSWCSGKEDLDLSLTATYCLFTCILKLLFHGVILHLWP